VTSLDGLGSTPPPADPDRVEQVAVADDVALHVRRWAGGDRRPFLLVHGLASNARLWDEVAAELDAAGHPAAAVDLRGHGRSSAPDDGYDVPTVADDLAELVEDLRARAGWSTPVVVGQSWGCNVVVELAARHPGACAAIAGVDGGTIELHRRFPTWEDCAEALAPPPFAGTPLAEIEARLRRAHPDWPESGIQGTLACFEHHEHGTVSPLLTRERHLQVLRGLWEHRPAERYPSVSVPVLLLGAEPAPDHGPADHAERVAAFERAATALPDARTVWMRGDHDLHAQHPRRVAALLVELADRADR
jgi:pimeloyl-ACP methyl ester carboxylesterase